MFYTYLYIRTSICLGRQQGPRRKLLECCEQKHYLYFAGRITHRFLCLGSSSKYKCLPVLPAFKLHPHPTSLATHLPSPTAEPDFGKGPKGGSSEGPVPTSLEPLHLTYPLQMAQMPSVCPPCAWESFTQGQHSFSQRKGRVQSSRGSRAKKLRDKDNGQMLFRAFFCSHLTTTSHARWAEGSFHSSDTTVFSSFLTVGWAMGKRGEFHLLSSSSPYRKVSLMAALSVCHQDVLIIPNVTHW